MTEFYFAHKTLIILLGVFATLSGISMSFRAIYEGKQPLLFHYGCLAVSSLSLAVILIMGL